VGRIEGLKTARREDIRNRRRTNLRILRRVNGIPLLYVVLEDWLGGIRVLF